MCSKRKMFPLLIVALLSILLVLPIDALGGGELPNDVIKKAQKEGEVVFYSSVPVWFTDLVIPKFEKKYGIKVRRFRSSSGKVVKKFFAERQRNVKVADVIEAPYPTGFHQMKDRGWLAPIMKELPVWGDFPAAQRHKDGYWLPSRILAVGIYINTKLVSQKDRPKKWIDLADPKWKGRLAVGDPIQCGGCAAWVLFVLKHPELGEKFLRKIQENRVTLYAQGGATANAMYSGQKSVATSFADYHPWYAKMKKKVPTTVIYPKEGFPIITSPIAIAEGAPHPNAAKVWANFLLGPEAQSILVKNGLYSGNKNAPKPTYKPPYSKGAWEPKWGELAKKGEVAKAQRLAAKVLRGR